MISLKIYSLSYTTQICKVLDAGIDPFDTACKDLMNIMTGAIAPSEIETDLRRAFDVGDQKFDDFVAERLLQL